MSSQSTTAEATVLVSHCGHNQSLVGMSKRLVRCPRCNWWVDPIDPSYRLALLETKS
jgi:hypothetical protein